MNVGRRAPSRAVVILLALAGLGVRAGAQAPTMGPDGDAPDQGAAHGPAAEPIPPGGSTVLPELFGHAAWPRPVPPPRVPQNPWLARNPFNNVHGDTWMSDAAAVPGPLGRNLRIWSSTLAAARRSPTSPTFVCSSICFDRYDRLVLSCSGQGESALALVDPVSLGVLASFQLPLASSAASATASAYSYLDSREEVVVAGADNTISVVRLGGSRAKPGFEQGPVYDVSSYIGAGDNMNGVMPDWRGRIWFAIRGASTIGVLDPETEPATVHVLPLRDFGEGQAGEIKNSFAMDGNDAYIVTTGGMYRLTAGGDGVPRIVWSETYENIGKIKPGQYSAGSGTTPTLLGGGRFVAIVDNADQTHVVVYRTDAKLAPWKGRVVCQEPVFERGLGAVEDSLIGTGLSLIVENNYNYTRDFLAPGFPTTRSEPGIARVDIDPRGDGCRLVWANEKATAPNVAPKLSTVTGLVYTITRRFDTHGRPEPGLDVYYWAALDFHTGKTAWERQFGTGFGFDSWYPGLAIGPNGTLYVGQYGGLTAIRDGR